MEDRIPQSPPIIPAIDQISDRPLWSVMIPTYNCINYIAVMLQSVLSQQYDPANMQIEVIDDCSTDGDVEQLVQEIGLGKVSFFRQPYNTGSLRNFETCILRSKGHYVHLLHGDDFILDGFYKEMDELFKTYPAAGAAFTNFKYCDHTSSIINIINKPLLKEQGIIPDFLITLASHQLVQPPAMVVKRSTYENLGSFYAVHFGEDWEMWTRISAQYPVAYSPKYLACYRVAHGIGISHNSFLSGQNIEDIKQVINIIQGYLPGDKRKLLKKMANTYYSVYIIKIANGLLQTNTKAAFIQVRGALGMGISLPTLYWAIRFFLMYLVRYKQAAHQIHIVREFIHKKKLEHNFAKNHYTNI